MKDQEVRTGLNNVLFFDTSFNKNSSLQATKFKGWVVGMKVYIERSFLSTF